MIVVSFSDYTPAARYDDTPWTAVRIEEAPNSSGPWTPVDTLALDPVDADPAHPASRSFTTESGTAASLWYRIVFVDATDDESLPTAPIRNVSGGGGGVSDSGPCTPWASGEDVAAVCDALDSSGDPSVYDNAALQASQTLYELSGRQFSGLCGPVTVRPCHRGCVCWVPSRALAGWGWGNSRCGPLSRIKLAGYPVREIDEVLIDGVAIDADGYRLDSGRWLTRLDDATGKPRAWPGCQNLARADSEPDTFSITYTFGQDPPAAGQAAAAALACAIAPVISAGGGECELPAGAVRVTRQGVEIDLAALADRRTGLATVDSFLETVNPNRLRRTAALWSPDVEPFAQRIG